jgi:hypothetical protein
LVWAVILVAMTTAPPASATAIASSSVQLQSLTVTPSSGTMVFSPFASWYAIVTNSLGEFDITFGNGVAGSTTSSVTGGTASAAADTNSLTASASADVNIVGNGAASAGAIARASYLPFSIVGASGPVTVQFDATVVFQQSLMTGALSSAHSDVGYRLGLFTVQLPFPVGGDIQFASSNNTVGPNSTWVNTGTWSFTASETLMPGVQYNLIADLGSSSDAVVTPEPGALSLVLAGILTPLVRRRILGRRAST